MPIESRNINQVPKEGRRSIYKICPSHKESHFLLLFLKHTSIFHFPTSKNKQANKKVLSFREKAQCKASDSWKVTVHLSGEKIIARLLTVNNQSSSQIMP